MGIQANVKNRPRYAQTASSKGSRIFRGDVLVFNEFSNSRTGIFSKGCAVVHPARPALDRCSSRSIP